MIIPVGTILQLCWGEYSDKVVDGPFRVLKPLDTKATAENFARDWTFTHPVMYSWQDDPEPEAFPAWLCREGYIEDVDGAKKRELGGYRFAPEEPEVTNQNLYWRQP
jgi:hypothetical protein